MADTWQRHPSCNNSIGGSSVHARLAHRVVQEARIQAFQDPLIEFRGGLVLGNKDRQLRQRRYNRPVDAHESDAVYAGRLSGEFIYGGPLHTGFGHFMSEMVHRIVPSTLLHGGAPWIFATMAGKQPASYDGLPAFVREIFDLLDVRPGDVRLVGENTIVEQLFVAEQGSEFGLGPKPGYLDDLSDYVTPRLDAWHRWDARPKKVYVSRARMPGGFFLGERYLEEQLVAEGFTVVHPELLPISVQMDHYRKAEVLVFAEGSACHGVELLGAGSLGRTYLLVRRDRLLSNFERILRPRAAEFAASARHCLIGTKFLHSAKPEPNMRLSVLAFDVKELVAFFRTNDIARLPTFSENDYLSAAEADLQRYLRIDLSMTLRSLLGALFLTRKNRRSVRPGARRELNEAFRRLVGSGSVP